MTSPSITMNNQNGELFEKICAAIYPDGITFDFGIDIVAKLVCDLYRNQYICVNINNNVWYKFCDYKWIRVDGRLNELLNDDIKSLMEICCHHKEGPSNSLTHIAKIRKCVDDLRFGESVMQKCSNLLHEEAFLNKLDSNENLIGFTNGVFDIRTMQFRKAVPSDYIYRNVGFDWIDYANENKDYDECIDPDIRKNAVAVIINDIKDYLTKLFNVELTESSLILLSSLLRGTPVAYFFVNEFNNCGGASGKSTFINLIRELLGHYVHFVPYGTLDHDINISICHGARCVISCGSEINDMISTSKVKQLLNMNPPFSLIYVGDNFPQVSNINDNDFWNITCVMPFGSRFDLACFVNDNDKRHYVMDNYLCKKFSNWKQPLMWLLITEYLPNISTNITRLQNSTIDQVQHVKRIYCPFAHFFEEGYIKRTDDDDKEHINMIYGMFAHWYKNAYCRKSPSQADFIRYLQNNHYALRNNFVHNVKCINYT